MEKIDLLEKLVEVQEMQIELMRDYSNLKNSYKDLEYIKNVKIQQLNEEITYQKDEIIELKRQNNELKQQYEELQKSLVSVEEN